MKTSGWVVAVLLVAGGLALQGCASSGDVHYAPGAAPGAAAPATSASMQVVTAVHTKSDFEAVRAAIEKQMQPGGRFSSVDPAGRATVDGRFQDMAVLFDQHGSIDEMTPTAMARINDDQNAINAVLAPQDGNRLICTQETHVGSHFPTRVCHTLSELRSNSTNTQQTMHQLQSRPVQTQKGGPV
jgi:hypothetical protein